MATIVVVSGCDLIYLPAAIPSQLLGLESYWLDTVASSQTPVLLVFQLAGKYLSLGRYHAYAGPWTRGGVTAYRRLTGGRIVPCGSGWIGCTLVLPSRTALAGAHGASLRPDQVMNRCVRGAMAAMRALGTDAFYPGRDAITCAGRELAMCTFEENPAGAILFELFIAVRHGLDRLPQDMESFDPESLLTCRFYSAVDCTWLERETAREIGFDDLAQQLENGYAQMLGGARRRGLTLAEQAAALELPGRAPDPALRLSSRQSIQLGMMEARIAAADNLIERAELYGDFIANSSGLADLERKLSGKPLDLMTVSAVVMQTYGDGSNFFLGCGDPGNLARLIVNAS